MNKRHASLHFTLAIYFSLALTACDGTDKQLDTNKSTTSDITETTDHSSSAETPSDTAERPSHPAPNSINVTSNDESISLSWRQVSNAESYRVYWSDMSGVNETSAYLYSDTNTYQHTSLPTNTTYYYRISVMISGEESLLSPETSATTNNNEEKQKNTDIAS